MLSKNHGAHVNGLDTPLKHTNYPTSPKRVGRRNMCSPFLNKLTMSGESAFGQTSINKPQEGNVPVSTSEEVVKAS